MDFEFSTTNDPVAAPGFAVRSIYHVSGDPAYNVRSARGNKPGYIALRTFQGEGCLEFLREPEIHTSPDTLLVFSFRDLQRYRCAGDQWIFWWFHFDAGDDIGLNLLECYHLPEVNSEAVLCREAVEKLSSRDPMSRSAASVIFSRLHSLWLMSLHPGSEIPSGRKNATDTAVEYIRGHYSELIGVADLAALCNMSVRRFQHLFAENTGMPPSTYLTQLRLSAAKEYLANTNLTIKEIAVRTGFCNEYYLSRRFKKKNGVPPGKFRSNPNG